MVFYKLRNLSFIVTFLLFSLDLQASHLEEEKSKPSTSHQSKPAKSKAFDLKSLTKELDDIESEENQLQFNVQVGRDLEAQRNAGIYFSKAATLQIKLPSVEEDIEEDDDEEHFELPEFSEQTLADMDYFLQHQRDATWKRNHLSSSLFVLVYDSRDETSKLIEGSILAKELDDTFDFDVSPNNQLTGFNCADFISSQFGMGEKEAMGDNAQNYTYVHETALRPLTDDGTHGDRLALDVMKLNPDFFFRLIRRTAHRSDLKILGMGARYYSSYDACDSCFGKIYNGSTTLKESLHSIAKTQYYSTDLVDANPTFPFYNLFYSNRPFGGAQWDQYFNKAASYVAYWQNPTDKKRKKVIAQIHYRFPGPSYFLNLSRASDSSKQLLAPNASKNIFLESGDIELNSEKVYLYVKEFEEEK